MLGCSRTSNEDAQKEDIELKGNGAHDIHDDSLVIAYFKDVKFWLD